MKKLLFSALIIISLHPGSYANKVPTSISSIISIGTHQILNTYYELTLESMFQEDERAKFETKFKTMNSPFVIDEIDYKKGIVIVKMTRKAPYNDVKYAFDQAGLRVIKEVEIVK